MRPGSILALAKAVPISRSGFVLRTLLSGLFFSFGPPGIYRLLRNLAPALWRHLLKSGLPAELPKRHCVWILLFLLGDSWSNISPFAEQKANEESSNLTSIHEHLPPQARRELKSVGWTKGLELAKVARRDGQEFDCATWLHKARELLKEQFKQAVEKELTGKEEEPSELIYFKIYKSQMPVIEQAIETAGLMLGTDKSRGYCLEMICADFLAGASLENENTQVLLQSMLRFFKFLPGEERKTFLDGFAEKAS